MHIWIWLHMASIGCYYSTEWDGMEQNVPLHYFLEQNNRSTLVYMLCTVLGEHRSVLGRDYAYPSISV